MLELTPAPRPERARGFVRIALGFVILLLVGGGLFWYHFGRVTPRTAILSGEPQRLAAPFEGRVAEVLVAPGTRVARGDTLIRLEDGLLKAAVADARARFALVSRGPDSPAAIRAAEASLQAAIQQARTHEAEARRELEHATTLHVQTQLALRALDSQSTRPPSGEARNQARLREIEAREAMDRARLGFENASRVRVAADADFVGFRAEMARLARLGGTDPALRDAAYTWLRDAEVRLAAATLRAAVDGQVSELAAHPGETIRQGQILAEVAPDLAFRPVQAFLTASESLRVAKGQRCVVQLPESGLSLDGVVEAVDPVPGADSTVSDVVAVAFIRLETPPSTTDRDGKPLSPPANAPVSVSIRVW